MQAGVCVGSLAVPFPAMIAADSAALTVVGSAAAISRSLHGWGGTLPGPFKSTWDNSHSLA